MKTTATQVNSRKKEERPLQTPLKRKIKDPLLQKIIAYLRLHHHLDTAFLISKEIHGTEYHLHFPETKTTSSRQVTYTLFIITNALPCGMKAPNPAQLMDEIYNHTQKQARVYLITYTAAAIAEKVDYGNNFLVRMLSAAKCVYAVDEWWVRFQNYTVNRHPLIIKRIRDHWQTRIHRAEYLHSITGTVDITENPAAIFEVLQNVLKQACLALIYLFWEYKPSYTGLPYLLHLCSHFADFPARLFHTHSYQNHILYRHLCEADQTMKFNIKTQLTLKQADKAWKKCEIFLEKAHTLAKQRFEILDQESREHIRRVSGKR